ncbi:GH92 family glycosyl hydrolase [Caulobacter segnis]|nr:GH92 family glycosyl hydrolase [Caulobacter segnis]UAL10131.1 GH92 family glycosyl hydrolase [Caulobacter segnis]
MAPMRSFRALLLGAALVVLPFSARAQSDLIGKVDPFVGTDGGGVTGGNTVPGAGVPFGFVSLSPDTTNADTHGYDSKSPIMGFSYTHVSGTGGSGKYGNFRVTPAVGPLRVNHLHFGKTNERAAPGYYAVGLGNTDAERIEVELTASRRVGFQRLTYPAAAESQLIFDVSSVVAMRGRGQRVRLAKVQLIDDHTLSGEVTVEGGWNPAPYTLYFHAVTDRRAKAFGAWKAGQGWMETKPGVGASEGGVQVKSAANRQGLMIEYDTEQEFSNRLGAYLTFDTTSNQQVQMKLAVSFISADQARANLAEEMPSWDFDAVRKAAEGQWGDALAKIKVEGGSDEQQRIFYSALYRSHTMPHDLSGENVWWKSDEPHYEDFYTLWDTFRTLHPLLTVIQPQRQRDMLRSLIDTYKHTGWMPDSRIAGANGMTQGGSNGDILVADAVVKKLGGFDLHLAYEALKKNAEVDSDQPFLQGRVLKDYLKLGYVPFTQTRSASRTLEYAYDDYAIGVVAKAMGKTDDAKRYFARAGNWKNIWDDNLGCVRPRYPNGEWVENYSCTYEYPDRSGPWWDAVFYEGNSLQYSTYVPQDVAGLMAKTGGAKGFVAWLDHLFDGHYSQGNEPDILAPYLYIHAGRPDRTDEIARTLMAKHYKLSRTGLPGNDDAGAMSSWYVWNAIGLYPNAGQPYYYIASPLFTRSVVALEGGKTFVVSAPAASEANRYVTAAKLNGKAIDRAWITHDELAKGGVLELTMGDKPSAWAATFQAPPNGQ